MEAQKITNLESKLVCELLEDSKTKTKIVRIKRKDCITDITFNADGSCSCMNYRTNLPNN